MIGISKNSEPLISETPYHIGAPGLKKSQLKPWQKRQWCLSHIDGAYLAKMEDVLDLYAQPPQPGTARLCIDERPCVLHGEVLAPLPLKPGAVTKHDYHYIRNGMAVALLAYNIDTGQRYVEIRPRRTKQDYAMFVQAAIAALSPTAQTVDIVNNNLNTDTPGAFYETFDAVTARQLARLMRFHSTPKHASWLNMAEIEFSTLVRQWSFTAQTARQKLHRHYQKVYSKV